MMPVRLLSKKGWTLLETAGMVACLFCSPLTIAADETPATGVQAPAVVASQPVETPAPPSGEAVWEGSPQAADPGDASASEEGKVLDESADREANVQEKAGIEMDIDIARRHTAWEYTAADGVKVTISSTDTDNKFLIVEKK